jgi:hypothetical protein
MLDHHARVVDALPSYVFDYLTWYFDCPLGDESTIRLSWALAKVGASQADVVLALLRMGERRFIECAEALVGRRIHYCPPCLRPPAYVDRGDPPTPDQRRITFVSKNPRLPTTGAFYRFKIFRPGMTIGQFMVRGGQRRDVRAAIKRGWIRVENWGAFA